jgi:hypothetical protein
MAEPRTPSSQELEKSDVWTDEEFEAYIDTELKKEPLHNDYPELFERGELHAPLSLSCNESLDTQMLMTS